MAYGMPPQLPPQGRPVGQLNRRNYFIGIGVGAIPLIVALAGIGTLINANGKDPNVTIGSFLIFAAVALYLVSLIAMIVCLVVDPLRSIGYGLLTTVIATPIIAGIACYAVVLVSLRQ